MYPNITFVCRESPFLNIFYLLAVELNCVVLLKQYKEKRMEQEKELLHSQTSWLNEELKTKSEELLSLSRQTGNQILELKCKLENKEDEACLL